MTTSWGHLTYLEFLKHVRGKVLDCTGSGNLRIILPTMHIEYEGVLMTDKSKGGDAQPENHVTAHFSPHLCMGVIWLILYKVQWTATCKYGPIRCKI